MCVYVRVCVCVQAQQWSLQSQFGGATGAAAVGSAGSQQALVPPTFPNLPVKFTEADGAAEAAAGTAPRASQVPNLSSSMAGLDQGQRWGRVCVCVCACVCVRASRMAIYDALSAAVDHHLRARVRARVCVCVCTQRQDR